MLVDIVYVVLGLVVLIWSADRFVSGAAETARYLGMSSLVVGIIIVGFGTSAPEIVVSAFAAKDGNPGIALGNAYGSNIANIGLVLGLTCLFYPLSVSSRIVKLEIPLLVLVLLVCLGFLFDGQLSRVESYLMLAMIAVIIIFNVFYGADNDPLVEDVRQQAKKNKHNASLGGPLLRLFTGLLLLLLSSHYLVKGAAGIAALLGVDDLLIGLTVIAVGTSLPELASSIAAAKKGEPDIVLGNIVGSCLFNLLAVVGIAGVIAPMKISPLFLYRDFTTTLFLTLLLWGFAFGIRKATHISKKEGGFLLLVYLVYIGYLLFTIKG